jgi:hypothetical protein
MTDRSPYWVAIGGFCIVNGIFSPFVAAVFPLVLAFSPAFFFGLAGVFFFTSLIVSTGTLILSGIPAAIFERLTGRTDSDATSMLIWTAAAALLSFKGFERAIGFL